MSYNASRVLIRRWIPPNPLPRFASARLVIRCRALLRHALWLLPVMLVACGDSAPEEVTVSERPEAIIKAERFKPQSSQLGVRLRVTYEDLVSVIETAVPSSQTDTGKDRVCKKILGIKACSTVRWNYTLRRTGNVSIVPEALETERVRIGFPFEFEGTAGVSGELAKVLGLSKVEFDGALNLNTSSRFDMSENWCPKLDAEISYRWTRSPRVELGGGLDFNVKKLVDSQLKKELAKVDEHLASAIDCEEIRAELAANWRAHSVALELPADALVVSSADGADESGNTSALDPMFFNVIPTAASFSGVKTEVDTLGLTLQLDALLSIDAQPVADAAAEGAAANQTTPTQLPPLETIPYEPGNTVFTPLIRAPYETLSTFSLATVQGQTYRSDSAAGEISVEITDIDIFPTGQRLGIGITFNADLPASKPVKGDVFLTALPQISANGSELEFTDLEFTKVLDNVVWNTLAGLFEGRIARELEENAKLDLREKLIELEIELLAELADTKKTRGALITADDLTVRLGQLIPEQDALTLVLLASTRLDVELPFEVFSGELLK